MSETPGRLLGVVIFEDFEPLDVFGPVEILGIVPKLFRIQMIGPSTLPVKSFHGPRVVPDQTIEACGQVDVLMVPGGLGTRREVSNPELLAFIRAQAENAEYVTSVCTGSALLAAAGVLDGRSATSNKRSFSWVQEQGPKVSWVPEARWVEDGNILTSSGVAAGMDMALRLLALVAGEKTAKAVANGIEYEWHQDSAWDPFARIHGVVPA